MKVDFARQISQYTHFVIFGRQQTLFPNLAAVSGLPDSLYLKTASTNCTFWPFVKATLLLLIVGIQDANRLAAKNVCLLPSAICTIAKHKS